MKRHEVVAEQLRQQIVTGDLPEGARLPSEEDLTETYGIARTTLREALRVLESQGLIEIRRGRGGGPVVTRPSLEPLASALAIALQLQQVTIGELDEARRLIEPHAAGILARRHTAEDIAALRSAIDDAARAVEAGNVVAFGQAATRFHAVLVERSGNRAMAVLSLLLRELTEAYYADAVEKATPRQMRRAVRSYERLVELILEGDRDAAVDHWQRQMAFTIDRQDARRPLTVYSGDAASAIVPKVG